MIIIRKARLKDINTVITLENDLYNNQMEYIRKKNHIILRIFLSRKTPIIF
jgi:hypothetical protein